MATTKEVKVVINGEEHVSGAASSAESGMMGFVNKIPGWAQAAAVLTVAWKAISTAVQAVGDFVMDSIDAYDSFASSQTKLAAQSKLTGVSLADLKASAQKAREEFGLSATVANDAATTVAKYAARAGDATLNNKLMAAALDLGAASGLTAADSMAALEQGLRGQDEGFDKLLGKNPSTLWLEYANANGIAVGKMTDTQKRMAELTAIVDAGNMVQGEYNERLEKGSGQQEKLNNRVDMAKVAFGAAIQPIRIVVIQGLGALLEIVGPVITKLGELANLVGITLAVKFQDARGAIGAMVEVIGKLIGNKGLQDWGKQTEDAALKAKLSILALGAAIEKGGNDHEDAAKKHGAASKTVVVSAEEAEKAFKKSYKMQEEMLKLVMEETVKYKKVIETMKPAIDKSFDPARIDSFNTTMKAAQATADTLMDKVRADMEAMPLHVEKTNEKIKVTSEDLANAARATLDFAQAFGAVDDKAARTLNSVINIASSIGRMYSGDVAGGATGLIGGIANLISALNNSENKRIVRELTRETNKLRESIGDLNLNVSGDDYAKSKSVMNELMKDAKWLTLFNTNKTQEANDLIFKAFADAGLTMGDLDRIGKEMGLEIFRKDGKGIDANMLGELWKRLNNTEFGTVGQDFGSQLEFFRTRQRLEGSAGTAGGMQGLFDFLRNAGGVSALDGIDLSDPNARNQLLDLFTRLNNGGVGAGEIGRLTGSQFSDLLEEIIQSLGDGLAVGTGPDVGTGGAGNGPGTGETGGTSPTITTGQMVSDAITAQTDALQLTLEAANGFHTRIADATESTAQTLLRIEELLVAANWTESMDRQLARSATLLEFQQGRGLSY